MAALLTRLADWEPRLTAYLDANAARPFEWGQFDCCLFAAGAVEVMTGEDFLSRWRGRYTTAAGSLRVLKREGFGSIEGPFTEALREPIARLALSRGDVVMNGDNIGIRWGAGALFVGDDGLMMHSLATVVRGWAVRFG